MPDLNYFQCLDPDPSGTGDFKTRVLGELKSYFHLTQSDEELLAHCRRSTDLILEEWQSKRINTRDPKSVTQFYVDTKQYCYELIGIEVDATPHRQAQLWELVGWLREQHALSGCDYGSGVGTLGIYLNRNGIRCDFADVSETNLKFIESRLKRRGMSGPRTYDLLKESLPKDTYDFVTAFDVIEHVTDPMKLIGEIVGKLKNGGLFVFNLLYDEHENTPHLIRDPDIVRKHIRALGLKKLGSIGEFKVYQKTWRPRPVNALIHGFDRAFWGLRSQIQVKR